MGNGSFDRDLFVRAAAARRSSGTPDFDYDADVRSRPVDTWKVHPDLDPRKIKDTPAGVRESRDSVEHPESTALAAIFDVTGSMFEVPKIFQEKLAKLMDILQVNGLKHFQVLVGALGDQTCDRVPLQVGQFESDNRFDDQLRKIVLERGGGGQYEESYDLALFFAARLTGIDCWEKRGKKGYLFLSGDEMPRDVSRTAVMDVFGIALEADIPFREILEEAKKRFEVFFIIPGQTDHAGDPKLERTWRSLLGENVLRLSEPEGVCELIASQIALVEGAGDLNEILDGLVKVGTDKTLVGSVSRALATVGAGAVSGKPAKATGPIEGGPKPSSVRRL